MSFDAENIRRKTEAAQERQARERQEKETKRIANEPARIAREKAEATARVQNAFSKCRELIESASEGGSTSCGAGSVFGWAREEHEYRSVKTVEEYIKKLSQNFDAILLAQCMPSSEP